MTNLNPTEPKSERHWCSADCECQKTTPTTPKPDYLKEFENKFCIVEREICADCKHLKDSHYWNGGGDPDKSGYDRCKALGCKCVSENWGIELYQDDSKYNHDIKSFLSQVSSESYERGKEEGYKKGLEELNK